MPPASARLWLSIFFATGLLLSVAKGEKSFVAVPHVFARAIQGLEADYGALSLHTNTDLDRLYPELKKETNVPFMDGIGSKDMEVVNRFLSSKGSPLQIDNPEPNGVYLAGTISIDVKWPEKGAVKTVSLKSGNTVPGTILPCTHFVAEGNDIMEVQASDGFSAFFMLAPRRVTNDFLALQQLATRLSSKKRRDYTYDRLHVPMIDLELRFPHKAVIKTIVTVQKGDPFKIVDARVHAKLQLDETGALAQAEEAISLEPFGVAPEKQHRTFEIRKDFIVWFEHKGICYFSAYIAEDCMKRPERSLTVPVP